MKIEEAIPVINKRIIEVIGHYVKLSAYGIEGTHHRACCLFHNGDTPSLSVSENKGLYKCFGCGVGGDAIDFIKRHESCDFMMAISIASKMLNIDVVLEGNNQLITDEF